MALRLTSAILATGLFGWALLFFFLDATVSTHVLVNENRGGRMLPTGEYVTLQCESLRGTLDVSGARDQVLEVGKEPADTLGELDPVADIALSQACDAVRHARSAAITLLSVPAVLAGVGAFVLPLRRRGETTKADATTRAEVEGTTQPKP